MHETVAMFCLSMCVRGFTPHAQLFRKPQHDNATSRLACAGHPCRQDRFWLGADLVVEIVGPDRPERDLVEKRGDYAEAGIPEYWIVNPDDATLTVLRLDGDTYSEHGVFRRGAVADSPTLTDFRVDVSSVFDAR
jgi:Uma2 family endonuclease